jgi:hypothetical protein
VRWFDGTELRVELVLVDLEVAESRLPAVEVVIGKLEDELLLGRNVLNKMRLVLDGPSLEVEVQS